MEIDLSDENLIEVPWSKISLDVTILHLRNNQLTRLSLEIGHLTQLADLFLSFNRLTVLPSEIGKLTQLR